MPYKIDSITANTITMVSKPQIVDPFPYNNSFVFTDFKPAQILTIPQFGGANGYTLECGLSMNETTEDIYFVYLGIVTTDSPTTQVLIGNVQGSFTRVPSFFFDSITTQFGPGAIVEGTGMNPNEIIDQAFVGQLQISPNEYVIAAVFFTPGLGETFRASVNLSINIAALNGTLTYSR